MRVRLKFVRAFHNLLCCSPVDPLVQFPRLSMKTKMRRASRVSLLSRKMNIYSQFFETCCSRLPRHHSRHLVVLVGNLPHLPAGQNREMNTIHLVWYDGLAVSLLQESVNVALTMWSSY